MLGAKDKMLRHTLIMVDTYHRRGKYPNRGKRGPLSPYQFFWGGGQVTSDFTTEVLINSKNLVMLFQNVLTFPTPNVGNFPEMMSYFTKLINDDVITQQVSNHWKAGCFCLVCVVVSS